MSDAESDAIGQVGETQVLGAVSQLTGLPLSILDEGLKVDMAEVRTFFADRQFPEEPDSLLQLGHSLARFAPIQQHIELPPDLSEGRFRRLKLTGSNLLCVVPRFVCGVEDDLPNLSVAENLLVEGA